MLALSAGLYWDRGRHALYSVTSFVLSALFLFRREAAMCRNCGARLSHELGNGWR